MTDEMKRLPTTAVGAGVLAALDALSRTTGLSKTYLIRRVLTAALADLGLLPDDVEPTPTTRKAR